MPETRKSTKAAVRDRVRWDFSSASLQC